jgi:hypothetical protein
MKTVRVVAAALAVVGCIGIALPSFAQSGGTSAPAASGAAASAPGGNGAATQQGTTGRADPTSPSSRAPQSTVPSAGRGLNDARGAATATPPRADALGAGSGAGSVGANLPAIGGVTPNRAELPGSAFTKLDAGNKGFVTLEDVRQLDGFDGAFRQSDQNRDGRLNASEFNAAWGIYTGNVR